MEGTKLEIMEQASSRQGRRTFFITDTMGLIKRCVALPKKRYKIGIGESKIMRTVNSTMRDRTLYILRASGWVSMNNKNNRGHFIFVALTAVTGLV